MRPKGDQQIVAVWRKALLQDLKGRQREAEQAVADLRRGRHFGMPDGKAGHLLGTVVGETVPGQTSQPFPASTSAGPDRKSTRLNSSHLCASRMPSSA